VNEEGPAFRIGRALEKVIWMINEVATEDNMRVTGWTAKDDEYIFGITYNHPDKDDPSRRCLSHLRVVVTRERTS
jgi:hypothetical protein